MQRVAVSVASSPTLNVNIPRDVVELIQDDERCWIETREEAEQWPMPFLDGRNSGRKRLYDPLHSQTLSHCARRPEWGRQEYLRAQTLPADRNPVVGRVPGDGQR